MMSVSQESVISRISIFHKMTIQDSEYVKLAEEAWKEALEIARSSDEWKEEKKDKNTVSQAIALIDCFLNL